MNKVTIISFLLDIVIIICLVIPITYLISWPYSTLIMMFVGVMVGIIGVLYIEPFIRSKMEIRK